MTSIPTVLGQPSGLAVVACLALVLTACRREDIQVREVPKEPETATTAAHAHAHGEAAGSTRLNWTLPAGWQEKGPDRMSVASFSVPGQDGAAAEVVVIPMGASGASDLDFLNIWRQRVQLGPVDEAAMNQAAEKAQLGPFEGRLFDLVSEKPMSNDKQPSRLMLAMARESGRLWFVAMNGPDDLVRGQKAPFVTFLGSLKFEAGEPVSASAPVPAGAAAPSVGAAAATSSVAVKPTWTVPKGWQELPPTQMVLAKFVAAGDAGAKAEISVSSFPGDVGGLLANVNRWRGQLGLGAITDGDLPKTVQALDLGGNTAQLVDVTTPAAADGTKRRLVGAIVPRGTQTWFYKMVGNEAVVAREREALIQFVKGVKYPNG